MSDALQRVFAGVARECGLHREWALHAHACVWRALWTCDLSYLRTGSSSLRGPRNYRWRFRAMRRWRTGHMRNMELTLESVRSLGDAVYACMSIFLNVNVCEQLGTRQLSHFHLSTDRPPMGVVSQSQSYPIHNVHTLHTIAEQPCCVQFTRPLFFDSGTWF